MESIEIHRGLDTSFASCSSTARNKVVHVDIRANCGLRQRFEWTTASCNKLPELLEQATSAGPSKWWLQMPMPHLLLHGTAAAQCAFMHVPEDRQ